MLESLEASFDRAMRKAGFVPRRAAPAPLHSESCVLVQCQDCAGWVHWCREPASASDRLVRCERCDAVRPVSSWAKSLVRSCQKRENSGT
jgi:hypothetical protein